MYYLIYTSYAKSKFTEDDLELLLLQSRKKNLKHDISGMLYYYGNSFIQLIEGEKNEVKKLYAAILADSRHYNETIIKKGDTSARFFPAWTMGYKFLSQNDIDAVEQQEHLGVIDRSLVLKLFKITNEED